MPGFTRPEDACRSSLLLINRPSVGRFTPFSPPVTPLGRQPPFSGGQRVHPARHPYRTAFASSRSFTPCALPRPYAGATRSTGQWPRAQRAYPVRQVVPIDGGRVPLYTGGDHTCVGRPLTSFAPAPPPLLGLAPLRCLSSALVTRRNPEASLPLPLPILPRSRFAVRFGFPAAAAYLRPHRVTSQ